MPLSQAPIYNLKAVLQETGVGADTLRAWERRYSLPKPQRTPGGHRLYSQRDIHLIKWLVARQADGLSISRAVKRWNELAEAGEDPLAQVQMKLGQELGGSPTNLDGLREAWLAACCEYDEVRAESLLNQAFAFYTAETVITEIILHGLHEVGNRWQHEQATVQQEHFVSGLAMRRLDALIAAAPVPTHPGTILLACPPTELHSLPLLYLNVILRRRGRNVVYLGADVPMEHLEETTRTVNAALVVMSSQRLATARTLQDAAALLARKRVRVAYGGRVFNQIPELQQNITGEFLGEAVDDCLDRIEELLARPITVRKPLAVGMKLLAQAYGAWRPAVEAALQRNVGGQSETAVDLTIANSYFGGALAAALEFGNVGYLAADMEWIRFLLTKPRLPFQSPREYFQAYAAAMREVMGSRGSEIAGQLERYAEHA
jgi:MerR family transcriptional regulator, light-induced transcriptional regulator